jgi:hypothetical protein
MEISAEIFKANSLTNLIFLMNSISDLKDYINNFSYHMDNLNSINEKISSNTMVVTPEDIQKIDEATREFFSKDLAKKFFRQHEYLPDKLERLWNILQEIYEYDPNQVVRCVVNMLEKRIPKNMTPDEKIVFRNRLFSKFLGTSNRVNSLTDLIIADVKTDLEGNKLDALSICGMLLSFVLNAETHLYFSMESIKEAVNMVGTKHDIEEIFSVESPVTQDSKRVVDILALRNAVSHASFNIEFYKEKGGWIIDFQSTLTGYEFNKRYTGPELLTLYTSYDNLRNLQELLIRMAFLKATLKYSSSNHH